MKQGPWNRLVLEYERRIMNLMRAKGPLAINDLLDLWASRSFHQGAGEAAELMVNGVLKGSAHTWREAAMQGTRSREIYQALQSELAGTGAGHAVQRLIAENALLIRSIPNDIAQVLTAYVSEQQQKGKRSEEIELELRKRLPALTKSKIRLIARTEVGKAETALTRARSEQLDIRWYAWETSEDQRVRPSHRNMDKVLINWDDPPSPEALVGEKSTLGRYAPGEAPNCRCLSLPLVSLDEVKWPARVYSAGSIKMMTRAKFSQMAEILIAA